MPYTYIIFQSKRDEWAICGPCYCETCDEVYTNINKKKHMQHNRYSVDYKYDCTFTIDKGLNNRKSGSLPIVTCVIKKGYYRYCRNEPIDVTESSFDFTLDDIGNNFECFEPHVTDIIEAMSLNDDIKNMRTKLHSELKSMRKKKDRQAYNDSQLPIMKKHLQKQITQFYAKRNSYYYIHCKTTTIFANLISKYIANVIVELVFNKDPIVEQKKCSHVKSRSGPSVRRK